MEVQFVMYNSDWTAKGGLILEQRISYPCCQTQFIYIQNPRKILGRGNTCSPFYISRKCLHHLARSLCCQCSEPDRVSEI